MCLFRRHLFMLLDILDKLTADTPSRIQRRSRILKYDGDLAAPDLRKIIPVRFRKILPA